MNRSGILNMLYKEYRNEIPSNTVKLWSRSLLDQTHWQHIGWSGNAREPYRHWAAYPEFDGVFKNIWEALNESIKEDGFNLKVDRIVMNLYNHGDSAWLHKDNDDPSTWTVILFLNEHWDIMWAGDFILVDDNDEIIQAFASTPGKFVLFKSNIRHCARPVSREAPFPRFSVAFQCKNDNNLQGLQQPKITPLRTTL